MKKTARWMINTFLRKELELRVRLFNILAMAGIAVSSVSAIAAPLLGESIVNMVVYTVFCALAAALLWYSVKSGRYQLCYLITIIAIFLIGFPVFFFLNGAYYGATPYFFVFAIVFTIFMLDGKRAILIAVFELLFYTGLCLYAYRYYDPGEYYVNSRLVMTDTIFGFVVAGSALGVTMYAQIRLYREQQKKLEGQNAALEEINRLKTEFLGNVSHELKTPLTVMSGYAQTTRQMAEQPDGPDGVEVSRRMQLISSEAERLSLMVGQVLDVTRMEEGRMVMEPVRCYVDEIIHAAIETHYPILNKNQNRLDIRIESGLSAVSADPVRISQVIVNLISNAVRFTANGLITVSARREGPHILVCVSDTGVGIAAERLPYLFERYNQKQKSGGGQDTGTGLGLYICKHIVEQHGGAIWIESEEGRGTAVFFTLPVL